MNDLGSVWERRRVEGVSIALGAMNFGGRTTEDESKRIIARAIERDIDLLDTANAYGDGASEKIIGRALRDLGVTAPVKLATKVGFRRVAGRPEGLAPEVLLRAIDESLENLGVDAVELWYLHVPDHRVALSETLDAVKRILDAGKIRAWGMSNYASWEMLEAKGIAASIGLPEPRIAQVLYNLLIRQLDIEWFSFAARHGVHTTVYNALAGGLLTGRHNKAARPAKGSRFDGNKLYLGRYWTERNFALVEAYAEVARRAGIDVPTLAHAWLAGCSGVDSILIGPASVAQLDSAIDACKLTLSSDTRAEIDRIHLEATGTDARYAR
jgi:aryl-alcohol dehydrogenase-like predicted oxidoreductase